LYECLTGRPPFKAATMLETLEQVRSQEPVTVRQLQPRVEPDLETICLKCLQKEPAKRYGSAEALAEDLRRFLAEEPIGARRVGVGEGAVKGARRRPLAASFLGVSVAATLLLLGVVGGFSAVMYETNQDLAEQRNRALAAEKQANEDALRAGTAEKQAQAEVE